MILRYDSTTGQWIVGADKKPLRDFYVETRKNSGKTVGTLERESGMSMHALRNIERPNTQGFQSNSAGAMLRALENLGYTIEIKEPGNA